MKKTFFLTLFSLALTLPYSNAQDNPEFDRWQIRVRGVGIIPNESSEVNKVGVGINVTSAFIPEIDFTYFFTKNMAAELLLGTSKHNISTQNNYLAGISNSSNGNVDLGHVWVLPPTLMLQYHFYPTPVWKPYVGVGMNYTAFYNEDPGVVQNITYKNSFGTALQLGVDINVSKNFFFNLDIKQNFLKTETKVDASNLAPDLIIPTKVKLDPFLLGFGVGIKI